MLKNETLDLEVQAAAAECECSTHATTDATVRTLHPLTDGW